MRDPRLVGIRGLRTIEDAMKAGGFVAGRPEDIVEALKAVEAHYPGLERVIRATPLDVQLAELDRFAKEVIPALDPPPDAPYGATSALPTKSYDQWLDPPSMVR
jgi:hypothetical protein